MPRAHRVAFYSPGSFMSESSSKPIESWSPALAVALAVGIVERHGAKPYAFRFSTLLTAEPVPDGEGGMLTVEPREVAQSGYHYLGGEVLTFDQIRARGEKRDEILLANMQSNGWPLVVRNCNSYQMTQPFLPVDCIVDDAGSVVVSGDAPEFVAYREQKSKQWAAEMELQRAEWERRAKKSA